MISYKLAVLEARAEAAEADADNWREKCLEAEAERDALRARAEAAEAERDRLRGVLEHIESIAPMWEGGVGGYSKGNLLGTLDEIRQTARAALAQQKEHADD